MKIAIAQPLKNTGRNACATGAERGVSNRGHKPRNSAWNRFLLHCNPWGLQWAV